MSRLKRGPQERIVASARRLFTESGFHQTSIADLARDAGVSVGAFYRHFESKAAIIEAVVLNETGAMLSELNCGIDAVLEGRAEAEATIVKIFCARIAAPDDGFEHEILAEAYRNSRVAVAITNFCIDYHDLFSKLASLASPALTLAQKNDLAEMLMACYFGLGHGRLFCAGVNELRSSEVIASYLHKCLRPS